MSTTIDSLDIQIATSVGQSPQKIKELATALGELKNQGKIGAATSAMKSLAKALDVLNEPLNALNPAKLQQLRGAMSGLANIQKASGLNSAVNTLKKIPEVINSLDTSKLATFERQMERLADALKPLATQLDKIGNGFAKLPARVNQVVTATNRMTRETEKATIADEKHSDAINAKSLNIMTAIHNFSAIMQTIQMVGDAISYTMSEAMEWDGIQYRFGRAFGEDAEEVYAYAQKINDVLGINMQQFMQYSSLYGSLLSGFGMAQEKVTTISVGLTELSYDIWAAYNDRFKSLEDASEAVRSAITGEIEPIRNAGIALTEASLQEYLDQVGMAQVSIEKLSEAQKAEVRYAAMMNAAMNQGIIGTYASEMQTAEGAVRNLSQAWKGLVQAFGSLFIPILQTVIPYVTALVNLLREAVAAIADFFGIAFFEIDWGTSGLGSDIGNAATGAEELESGLNGAAQAAKKLKNYTMGFDELNVIQPPDESSSGGGSGAGSSGVDWGNGLDLDTMWDESVFAKASRQVDELKQKIQDWFEEWKTQIAIIGGALGALSLTTLLEHLGTAVGLGDGFLSAMGTIKKLASSAIVITLQYSLVHELLENFIEEGSWKDYISALVTTAIGTGILYSQWGKNGLIVGLAVTAVAAFNVTFADGKVDSAEEVTTGLTGLATGIGAVALAWPKLKSAVEWIKKYIEAAKQMAPEVGWFAALFPKLSGWLAGVGGAISGAAKAVTAFLGGISAPVWGIIAGVIAAVASVAVFLYKNWEKVTEAAKSFFDQNIAPKLEKIREHWDTIVEAIQPVIKLVKFLIQPIVDLANAFGEWWEAAEPLSVLGDIFEVVGSVIFSAVSGVIMGAINMLIGAIENVMGIFSGVALIVGGMIDAVVAIVTGGDIIAAFEKIGSGVLDVFYGVPKLIIDIVVDLVEGVINWFRELWDVLVGHSIVPDTINAIVDWFLSLPDKILQPVQNFVNDVIQKFKNAWNDARSWWKSTVAPKFTAAYWKNVFATVVSGASSKLGEIKGELTGVWNGVKSWFNSNVAPKLTIEYWKNKFNSISKGLTDKWAEARSWWNNNKPTLNSVQAAIASIKDKLLNSWNTAREWWNSKPALNAISFTIASIKDKIVEGWNKAKNWLDSQSLKLNIKTPHFSVGWNWSIPDWQATVADFLFGKKAMPYLDVSWYAQGGTPAMGEMFVAREAGPELVGRIGNRNAVVNNDQIVAAVAEGVYGAVVAAMSSYSGDRSGQEINLYLDGKQITATVEKRQKERGATLMTGGMVYGY